MAESYGLDARIDKYRGKRPIGLYRWDLDCLLDVLEMCPGDKDEYPLEDSPQHLALKSLYGRLREGERDAKNTTGDEPTGLPRHAHLPIFGFSELVSDPLILKTPFS